MEPIQNMDSLILKFSQDVDKLKDDCVCEICGAYEDLHQLVNCTHLVCKSCINSTCPVCDTSLRKIDASIDETFEGVLKNIRSLSNISKDSKEKPTVRSFFAPECTITKRDHKGEIRLHKDCRDGNFDKVEALLQTGIDVNIQDFAGWTPLHEAVTAQKANIVKLLLNYGAFVSIPGLHYVTPLHAAIQDRNIEIIKLLIEYGAELMCFNKDGKTPIDLCHKCDDMLLAVCLTERRHNLYKIYTIPHPKVFFMNVDSKNMSKLSDLPAVSISMLPNYLIVGDVTYVVVGNDKPDIMHVQAAMLQGACVVNVNWITNFIAKRSMVNPMDYLVDIPGYALQKAVMNMFNKLPKLFDGLRFYFYHSNEQKIGGYTYTIEDFKKLINLGNGKVLTRRPVRFNDNDLYYPYHASKESNLATTTYYLIYDEKQSAAVESNTTGMKYKSARWLIECINNFTIIS